LVCRQLTNFSHSAQEDVADEHDFNFGEGDSNTGDWVDILLGTELKNKCTVTCET
jgi:hypothetical protein